MHRSRCSLLTIIVVALFSQDLVLSEGDVALTQNPPSEWITSQESTSAAATNSTNLEANIFTNLVQIPLQNASSGTQVVDLNIISKSDDDLPVKSIKKKEIDDKIFNDFKRFLLFPFLPYLFPPEDETSPITDEDALKPNDNGLEGGKDITGSKPFILFDFAFNIREIPLANGTGGSLNDSKIINVKKLSDKPQKLPKEEKEDEKIGEKKDFQTMRRRRSISKREKPEFFDDFPLFPAPQIDDFFAKPNLFFPGLSPHKAGKKMSRRKRDMKIPDIKSDLEFFMNAIDQAFMQTKNDFEQTDPILSFPKPAVEVPFRVDKKNDFFDSFPSVITDQERPNLRWKIQRNIKRAGDPQDKGLSPKSQKVPMIIVDKVVKIGEFHVRDDDHDKNKLSKDMKNGNEIKRKYIDGVNHDEIRIPLLFEKDDQDTGSSNHVESKETTRRQRDSDLGSISSKYFNIKSKEIKIIPQMNSSFMNDGNNMAIELKKKDKNTSENGVKQDNFLKMMDPIKRRIKIHFSNTPALSDNRLRRDSFGDRQSAKIPLHDDLKRNITQVLNRFFELVKKLDDAKLIDKLDANEREIEESFDWTEKETLQNVNIFGKNSMGRRRKEAQFEEYLDAEKKERQVANYLFLTVTLPTMLVFALVLLVCFFNLQVKGKICTKLFRPKQIFLVEEKSPVQFNGKSTVGVKNPQPI